MFASFQNTFIYAALVLIGLSHPYGVALIWAVTFLSALALLGGLKCLTDADARRRIMYKLPLLRQWIIYAIDVIDLSLVLILWQHGQYIPAVLYFLACAVSSAFIRFRYFIEEQGGLPVLDKQA